MLLHIDLQSETPIYTQLVQQIIEGVAKKQLLPGEPLPSVRSLASDLGVNLHTVNKAYQLLKQEGYVQIHRQKGVTIHPESIPPADEHFVERIRQQLRPMIAEAVCKQMSEDHFIQQCRNLFNEFQQSH